MADYVFEDPFDDSLEDIRNELFSQVEDLWPDPDNRPDLREGSLMWTLLSPIAFEIQRFQTDLNVALELGFLQFTFGEWLDLRGIELGLPRKEGSEASGILRFFGDSGYSVPVGTSASTTPVGDDDSYVFDTTDSGYLIGVADPVSTNEKQLLKVTGYADFTLTLDDATTGPLPYNATAAQVKTALDALNPTAYGSLNTGGPDPGVTVTGTTLSGMTIEFGSTNTAAKDIKLMVVTPMPVNEVQTLQITGTGSFKVFFDGIETTSTFTETTQIGTLISAINTELGPFSPNYNGFSVTTTYAPSTDPVTNAFDIVFSGGPAEYKDVPNIHITSIPFGDTIGPLTSTTATTGANLEGGLDSGDFVEETQKGRNAVPVAIAEDINEIQSLNFKPAELETVTLTEGQPGLKNRIELLTIPAVPTTGSFHLRLSNDSGVTYPYKTITPIQYNDSPANIKSKIESMINAGITTGDVSVTLYEGGPNVNGTPVTKFKIEYVNNLRYSNNFRLRLSTDNPGDNTLVDAGSNSVVPLVTTFQTASSGLNEVQRLQYKTQTIYDSSGIATGAAYTPASGGTFTLTLNNGSTPATVPAIGSFPYNVSAGDLQKVLNSRLPQDNPVYGNQGVNAVQSITHINGTTFTAGSYRLTFNNGITSEQTANIPYDADASDIQTALNALGTVNPGDIIVSGISPSLEANGNQLTFTFDGQYSTSPMALLTVQDGTGNPLVGGIPADLSVAHVVTGLASAFDEGNSFVVTGGQLDTGPLTITYQGKNRFTNFKPMVINSSFVDTPAIGNLTLTTQVGSAGPNGGVTTPLPVISLATEPLTQDVEAAFNSALALGAGAVHVKVATGFQTIEWTGGVNTNITLLVDNGYTPLPPAIALNTGTATAASIEAAINALVLSTPSDAPYTSLGTYSPSVRVEGTGNLDSGNVFTIHFDSATPKPTVGGIPRSYKSLVSSDPLLEVGPKLTDEGAIYEIEYVGDNSPVVPSGGTSWNNVKEKALTLTGTVSGTDFQPRFIQTAIGAPGVNQKYFMTLSHPNGYVQLKYGSGAVNTTSPISVGLDTRTTIKYKLEELTAIGANNLTTTGGTGSSGTFFEDPINIEFSGATVDAGDRDEIITILDRLLGGTRVGILEEQPGHDEVGLVGTATNPATVQYVYTLVTKLGVKDGDNDPDYEPGYGETAPSPVSAATITVPPNTPLQNKAVQVQISPIQLGSGLTEVRAVRVYRSLNGGAYRLVATIGESDLVYVEPGDEPITRYMSIRDNISEVVFNGITTVAPSSNTTAVLDLPATAQEILDENGFNNGSLGNVAARTIVNIEDANVGVSAVTNPEPFGGGSDREDDDTYRARLIEFAQKDPGAGNIDDYISWAKEIAGVENVSVIPEWQEIYGPLEGPGTVKVVVSGQNNTIVTDEVLEEVRLHIAGTIAIEDPDQENASATTPVTVPNGGLEAGVYEYVYTYINVGKGETRPSVPSKVIVEAPHNAVEVSLTKGPAGIGVQNTIGRRIYRRKVDIQPNDDFAAGRFNMVAEILDNSSLMFVDDQEFDAIPKWFGKPAAVYGGYQFDNSDGPYIRRLAPNSNSTSLFDGEAPVGAHVTVESITEETIWVSAEIYPASGWSVDGAGGRSNLTTALDTLLSDLFATLPAGQDVKIVDIMNVIHDHPGVKDFRNTLLYSPLHPTGTDENIVIGPGVTALYSTAGSFSTWPNYPYDK